MGVTITSRVASWTWEDSPVAWENASVTWDGSERVYFTAMVEEDIKTRDVAEVSMQKKLVEVCNISDGILRKTNTYRHLAENIDISAREPINPNRVSKETLSVKELFDKKLTYQYPGKEAISLSEDMDRTVVFAERVWRENITIQDAVVKSVALRKEEDSIGLSDKWLENANAVMEMISFFKGAMTESVFVDRSNTVNGYSIFQKFLVGDYEYQRALIRVSVKSKQLDSGINLFNVVHNVDIPDTDDRGRVTVTDTTKPTRVYFNKFYYTSPEVAVALVGGTTADGFMVPVVINTNGKDETGRYFEFELKNASGQRATGTVIWVAKGY